MRYTNIAYETDTESYSNSFSDHDESIMIKTPSRRKAKSNSGRKHRRDQWGAKSRKFDEWE